MVPQIRINKVQTAIQGTKENDAKPSDEVGFHISQVIHAKTSGTLEMPKETGSTGSTPRTIQILY